MASLHNTAEREALKGRVRAVRPDAVRRWGAMSVDQMMHHVNVILEMCMGLREWGEPKKVVPIPRSWLTWIVLTLPWPKGAPTAKAALAGERYDLEAEKQRCLELLEQFASLGLTGPLAHQWPEHIAAGRLTGEQYSRLQHKHVAHHLRQFSA
jgi:hypothetical protein